MECVHVTHPSGSRSDAGCVCAGLLGLCHRESETSRQDGDRETAGESDHLSIGDKINTIDGQTVVLSVCPLLMKLCVCVCQMKEMTCRELVKEVAKM